MKRLILIAGLMVLPLLVQAVATTAPETPAATAIAVVGKPKLSLDGGKKFKEIKLGQGIKVGSLIRTGATGKLTLLLSEGSNVHLGNNSEITLKAHNPEAEKGGTLFSLAKGLARFVVSKLQPGKHFEVETANAVAAVKGTDFETGINADGTTDVKVFESETKGSVQMSDLDRIKSILIGENGTGSYDGKDFKTGKMDPAEVEKMLDNYKGLPATAPVPGAKTDDKADKDTNKDADSRFNVAEYTEKKEMENKINAIVADTLQDFFNKKAIDDKLDNVEHNDDVSTFKVVIDHNGDQTLVTQSTVISADSLTISNATVASRNSGVNAGDSYAIETTDWNQALPLHWASVVYRPLSHPDNLDAGGYPKYFRTQETLLAGNPFGDTLEVVSSWHAPNFCVNCGNTLQQGISQDYYTNGVFKGNMDYVANNDIDAVTSSNGLDVQCQACSDDMYMNSTNNYSLNQQGVDFGYYNNYKGGLIFTQQITLHDDNGVIHPTSGFNHPSDYLSAGLSDTYNTSVVFNAPNFSMPIDLIFLTGYFQTFDLIQMPYGYYTYGGGL